MKAVDNQTIERLVGPIVVGLGYDLVDLSFQREAGGWILRLFIDVPPASGNAAAGAVGLDDCSRVSHQVSTELDVADLIHVPFNLEVSSPGLDRPLRKESDFRRYTGKKVRIRIRQPLSPVENRRNFTGTIAGVDAGKVKVDVEGQVFEIPVETVEKANLQPEL